MSKRSDQFQNPPRLLTVDEVAEFLGVSTRTVGRLMHTGKLGFHRVGIRAVRISPEALDKYLKATRGLRS